MKPTSHSQVIIALDALGGDHALEVSVPAAIAALEADPSLHILLTGPEAKMETALTGVPASVMGRLDLFHAPGLIPMEQKPARALRNGRGSSLWAALEAVADGRAHGCVSAGNTGALMILARKLIGMLPGIDRPALMAWLPSASGHTYMLDLGANIEVRARHLKQFGIMGSIFAESVDDTDQPRVGLLNVGREDSKGHGLLQKVAAELDSAPVNYVGFVEGDDIYNGQIDVAVCDGLIGNAVLKSSEGLARLLFQALRDELQGSIYGRLIGWAGKPILRRWVQRFDPGRHNGAALLGLRGTVVKSHGSADVAATVHAINTAAREARGQVPEKIAAMIERIDTGQSDEQEQTTALGDERPTDHQ